MWQKYSKSTRNMLEGHSVPRSYQCSPIINCPECLIMPPLEASAREPPTTSFFLSFVLKLQYAVAWVRFDISFTVSQLASHMSNPGQLHWTVLHHLMEYLKLYPNLRLEYRRGPRTGKEL